MKKISIEKCDEKEVLALKKQHKLTLWWAGERCFKLKIDDEVVGLLEAEVIEDEDILDIDNFEVFEKGKNIGSEIVEELKKSSFGMCLYAQDDDCKRFWERHGFVAQDDEEGVPKHYYIKASSNK